MNMKNIFSWDKIKKLNKIKSAKFRYRSLHWLVVFLAVALVVLVNIGAKILTDKFSLKADLTKNKVFSITEDSINYISSLDKNVEVIVLNNKDNFVGAGDYYAQADSVINEYAKHSDKIVVSYINIDQNPNIKSEYPEDEVKPNGIIVRCGGKHKVLSAYDIFDIRGTYTGAEITSSKAEQVMTSAIINITSDEKTKINMITGFDEVPCEDFVNLLESNNYEVNQLSMLNGNMNNVPVSIIYSPNRDYDKDSIEKIKNYLENGGNYGRNLVYFINPQQMRLNNIEKFVNEWGIGIKDGLVFETDPTKIFTKDRPFNTICEYDETSEYTKLIKNPSIPVGMPISRPLEVLDESKVSVLLKFSESSGVMPSTASQNWFPTQDDIKGPIPCLVMSTITSSQTGEKSTLTVVGSAIAADGGLLQRNTLNNSLYFLNLLGKLSAKKDTVNIEPKSIGVHELNINPLQAIIIAVAFAIVLPLLVIISGFIVWIIRRRQ